jgi:hypothetical protein
MLTDYVYYFYFSLSMIVFPYVAGFTSFSDFSLINELLYVVSIFLIAFSEKPAFYYDLSEHKPISLVLPFTHSSKKIALYFHQRTGSKLKMISCLKSSKTTSMLYISFPPILYSGEQYLPFEIQCSAYLVSFLSD